MFRFKKLFWVLFILFDFCILAAFCGGIYYLESDAPRTEFETFLSAKLGRKVVFNNNFDLIFYPWLGLNTGPIAISSATDAEYPQQLMVKNVDFKVRLIPLLFGDLEVDTIIVDSPVFRMNRGNNGKLDLPSMNGDEKGEIEAPSSRIFKSISVRGMNVVNATYIYKDIASGNSFNVSGVNVRTGLLRKNTPLAFDITAMLDTDFLDLSAITNIKGLVDFSRSKRTVSLSDTSVSVSVKSPELLGPGESIQGIANLECNLVEGLIDVKGLVIQGAGLRLSGAAVCRDIYNSPDFKGSLKSTRFDPKAVFSKFTPVPIPSDIKDIFNSASFAVDFHSTLEKTELSNMVLKVDKTSIQGVFSLKDYKHPWAEFDVSVDSIGLDPYSRLFKLGKNISSEDKISSSAGDHKIESKPKRFYFRDLIIADLVHKLPCKGKLEIGELTYSGMKLDNTRLAISPGPQIANLSIGKGSYLDGDFSLMADLGFNEKNESDILFLSAKGAVSPFSLIKIPAKIEKVSFRSGKAGLKLKSFTSHGKTLVELVRNIKLNLVAEAKRVAASLSHKDIPAKYRNIHADSFTFGLAVSPLSGKALEGHAGRNARIKFAAVLLKPDLKLDGNFNGEIFSRRAKPDSFVFKNSNFDLSFSGNGISTIKKETRLVLGGEGSFKERSLKLDNFSIQSGKINLKGDVDAKNIGAETASASGHLKLGNTKCDEFFSLFGVSKPETQDKNAFDSVEFDTVFQLNGENLNLHVNHCRLDNATATGTFELVDFKKPVLNFVINGDNIDIDTFLPPEDNSDTDEQKNGVAKPAVKLPEWQFPDAMLSAINAKGKVVCNYFRIFDFGASKISADVDMKNSIIGIHNISAKFHEGNLAGKLDLGLYNGTVSLDTDFEARGFEAGLFFSDYTGHDYVKGLTSASLQLKGYSTANENFTNTMTGKLLFKITDGSYLFAGSTGQGKKSKKQSSPTKFSVMNGAIQGEKGDFKVNDYLLKTNYLTATARGGFSFPKDSIDLRVNADIIQLPNMYLKIVNALFDAITGVNVNVTGKLNDPKVEVKGLERWSDVLGDVLGLPEESFMFFRRLIF